MRAHDIRGMKEARFGILLVRVAEKGDGGIEQKRYIASTAWMNNWDIMIRALSDRGA